MAYNNKYQKGISAVAASQHAFCLSIITVRSFILMLVCNIPKNASFFLLCSGGWFKRQRETEQARIQRDNEVLLQRLLKAHPTPQTNRWVAFSFLIIFLFICYLFVINKNNFEW